MKSWIRLDECDYKSFCGSELSHSQKWLMIQNSSVIKDVCRNKKLEIIFELFFQSLLFASKEKLSYFFAVLLIDLIEKELKYTMRKTQDSLLFCEASRKDQAVFKRFLNNVSVNSDFV